MSENPQTQTFERQKSNSRWWRHYPDGGCPQQKLQAEPEPHQVPVFAVGDLVRLRGKPDRVRRVWAVEWHRYCHGFVYVVETRRGIWLERLPYWFADQLVPEDK